MSWRLQRLRLLDFSFPLYWGGVNFPAGTYSTTIFFVPVQLYVLMRRKYVPCGKVVTSNVVDVVYGSVSSILCPDKECMAMR